MLLITQQIKRSKEDQSKHQEEFSHGFNSKKAIY